MESVPEMNKGTSKVFFALVSGLRTPGEIAKRLDINHSAVIQQLNRLSKAHLLKFGEEKGRKHYYEIDWEGYCGLVMTYLFPLVYAEWERESERWLGASAKEKKETEAIAQKLSKNRYLKRLIIEYTKEYVKLDDFLDYTISDVGWEFNENLESYLPAVKGISKQDKDMKEFIRMYGKMTKAKTVPQAALENAIHFAAGEGLR
jgi:predicted transcriptional regulator